MLLFMRLLAGCVVVLIGLVAVSPGMARTDGASVPDPGPVSLIRGPCPGLPIYEGCADLAEGVVYLNAAAEHADPWGPTLEGEIREHELGHIYDWRYLSETERISFRRLVRAPTLLPWWGEDSVSEWFADAYASCSLGRRIGWPGYWSPHVGRGRDVCRFIASTWE